jgi:hypothetical protein
MSRYLIGIDLGTTNCAVTYVDLGNEEADLSIHPFPVLQQTQPGMVEARPVLPSFCFWDGEWIAGVYAKEAGVKVPTRQVASAKSWLSYAGADRSEPILPIRGDHRLSPVQASAMYLRQIKESWNKQIGRGDVEKEFEQQEVILTVPASFDEVARSLTLDAAKLAGYEQLTLVEEPQAAFYNWLADHETSWQKTLAIGERVLVCDVGGGTTDFSLIEISDEGFSRQAVGSHLLLGGDNMDKLLLAKTGPGHDVRRAKEELLTSATEWKSVRQGSGASFVGGSSSVTLSQEEVRSELLARFFGQYTWEDAHLTLNSDRSQLGDLPEEPEPSITKHLAAFIHSAGGNAPDYVLFNGGTMRPECFQGAILDSLERWFGRRPQQLPSSSLDLAVARGAAYYGKVRRGHGIKIKSGLPRAYYIGLELDGIERAMTLLKRGAEEGTTFTPTNTFALTTNQPVSFQLYTSQVRLDDQPADLIAISATELQTLPVVQTVLKYGKPGEHRDIAVTLTASLTAIGTLDLTLKSETHTWKLDFQVENASGKQDHLGEREAREQGETVDEVTLQSAQRIVADTFSGSANPSQLMTRLERETGCTRGNWPPSLLRGIADAALLVADKRKRSVEHESRWWNLVGFSLRPGYGYPLDDHRMKQVWRTLLADKPKPSGEALAQQLVCLRRIAGGLGKGQQQQLAGQLIPSIVDPKNDKVSARIKKHSAISGERLRALASLELLEPNRKTRIGDTVLKQISEGNNRLAGLWALGRLGARQLLRGSGAYVVPPAACELWVQKLLKEAGDTRFTLRQLSRLSPHDELNLSEETRGQVVKRWPELTDSLDGKRTVEQQEEAYGEKLPVGLKLLN